MSEGSGGNAAYQAAVTDAMASTGTYDAESQSWQDAVDKATED